MTLSPSYGRATPVARKGRQGFLLGGVLGIIRGQGFNWGFFLDAGMFLQALGIIKGQGIGWAFF